VFSSSLNRMLIRPWRAAPSRVGVDGLR
jgi:hypothetical protein